MCSILVGFSLTPNTRTGSKRVSGANTLAYLIMSIVVSAGKMSVNNNCFEKNLARMFVLIAYYYLFVKLGAYLKG
jgi:hypothetical protein